MSLRAMLFGLNRVPPPAAPPAAPTGLTAVPTGAGRDDVLLTWVDNSADETGFIVEYSVNGSSWSELTTTAADAETYTHTTPTLAEVTHYYRVRAENGNGESANATTTIDGDLLGEVGCWLMNEASGNALDSIGANPLTDINGVGSASDGDGNYRTFAGTDQKFTHADNATFSMGAGVRCTIAIWVNPTVLTSQRSIVVKRENLDIDYWLRFNGTALDFSATSDGTVGTLAGASKSGASTGAWQFAVAVYDGSTLSANLDNGTPATTAFSADIFDGTVSFNVGLLNGADEPFVGGMRRLRLWKRALSAAQLTKVFNDGY